MRTACAILVGLIAGMAFNMAIFKLNLMLYPMPEGVTFDDPEAVAPYIEGLPVLALLIVMVAHLGQAFLGGWVAAKISKNSLMLAAMTVGVLSMLAGIYMILILPSPTWMWIEIPLYLVAAWIAGQIELKRRAAALITK